MNERTFEGKNLRFIRKAKGITQKKLGEMLGVSQSAVQTYESGRTEPNEYTIVKLNRCFEVNSDFWYSDLDSFNNTFVLEPQDEGQTEPPDDWPNSDESREEYISILLGLMRNLNDTGLKKVDLYIGELLSDDENATKEFIELKKRLDTRNRVVHGVAPSPEESCNHNDEPEESCNHDLEPNADEPDESSQMGCSLPGTKGVAKGCSKGV